MTCEKHLLSGAVVPQARGLQHALLAACGAVGLEPFDGDGGALGVPNVSGTSDMSGHTPITCAETARELLDLPKADRVCIVFVDGLGFEQLSARTGHVPHVRSFARWDSMTTIAPSTTAAALTSFATATLPGQTSMLSYVLRIGARRTLTDLITFKTSPIPPEKWQVQPTLFERLGDQACHTVLVEDPKYHNSGLTNAAWRGAPTRYAKNFNQRVDIAVEELRSGRKLVYLYWGNLDHQGHKYGVTSSQWISELEMVDAEIGRLRASVPAGTLIVLTADHGMVQDDEKLDLAYMPHLDQGVTAVAGEERAFQIYTPDADAVADRWRVELGERAWILTKHELERSQIFGSLTVQSRDALGDVIVFAREHLGFVDSRVLSQSAIAMKGVHGSLTAAEMHVPWIVEIS